MITGITTLGATTPAGTEDNWRMMVSTPPANKDHHVEIPLRIWPTPVRISSANRILARTDTAGRAKSNRRPACMPMGNEKVIKTATPMLKVTDNGATRIPAPMCKTKMLAKTPIHSKDTHRRKMTVLPMLTRAAPSSNKRLTIRRVKMRMDKTTRLNRTNKARRSCKVNTRNKTRRTKTHKRIRHTIKTKHTILIPPRETN